MKNSKKRSRSSFVDKFPDGFHVFGVLSMFLNILPDVMLSLAMAVFCFHFSHNKI